MNEKEIKEKTDRLVALELTAHDIVKEYNKLAREVDYTSRMALVTADCNIKLSRGAKTLYEAIAPHKTVHDYAMFGKWDYLETLSEGSGDGWISSQKGC